MMGSNRARIRTLLTVEYSNILKQARKSEKGLRMPYIFSIMLVGDNTGCRLVEACNITGKTKDNIYNCFNRAQRVGYLVKRDKRYYLTDKGQTVYNTVCREFDTSMKEIIKVLVEEARRQI